MALRISQAIIVLSGAVTGLAAIAALSYFQRRTDTSDTTRPNSQNSTTSDITSRGTSRLRRSRHVRIRRTNNTDTTNTSSTAETEPAPVTVSETEEDIDNGKMLSFIKDWSDDDNKNLLNLLHAISENQSRKGKHI